VATSSDPTEMIIRNLLLIERLANGVALDAEVLIRDLFDEIAGELAKLDPTMPAAMRHRLARVTKIMDVVRGNAAATYTEIHRQVRLGLAEIGVQQGVWAGGLLAALAPGEIGVRLGGAVGLNMMKAAVDAQFVEGRLLKSWFADQRAGVGKKVEAQIRLGVLNGEPLGDIVRRVRGRSTGKYRTVTLKSGAKRRLYKFTGGVLQTTTRDAEAVVRTAVNQITNHAHLAVYEANTDLLSGVMFQATLDSNTTLICGSLDGKTWPVGSPDIRTPPLHWQCRSQLVPQVKGFEGMEATSRASEGGPVKGSTRYDGWLKSQPKGKQETILGKRRSQLFRDGKVTLKDMVRRDGSVIRASEL